MSALVQFPDGKIKLLVKGSDNIIGQRLADKKENKELFEETDKFLTEYAK